MAPQSATKGDALRLELSGTESESMHVVSSAPGIAVRAVAGRSAPGTGMIKVSTDGSYLQYKAPGSDTYGPQGQCPEDGEYIFIDGEDDSKWIRVYIYVDYLAPGEATVSAESATADATEQTAIDDTEETTTVLEEIDALSDTYVLQSVFDAAFRGNDGDYKQVHWDQVTSKGSVEDLSDVTSAGSGIIITSAERTNYDAAYAHVSNDGTDHSFIDQDVSTGASPTFASISDGTATMTGGTVTATTLTDGTAVITGGDYATALTKKYILNSNDNSDNYFIGNGDDVELWIQGALWVDFNSFGLKIQNASLFINSAAGNPTAAFQENGTNRAFITYNVSSNFLSLQTDNAASAATDRITITGEVDSATMDFTGIGTLDCNGVIIDKVASISGNSDNLVIGTGAADSHSLSSPNDLFIVGKLEVDGTAFFDARATFGSSSKHTDFVPAIFGNGDDVYLNWAQHTTPTAQYFEINLDNTYKNMVIGTKANWLYEYQHTASTDPTLFIHSNNGSTTEWISAAHDRTDGVVATGAGSLALKPNSGVVVVESSIKIKEEAAAAADTAGYGQLWVKNAAPCELWFTDDAGTDTQIV